MAEQLSNLSTAATGCNLVALAVLGADWTGVLPVGDPFVALALGVLFAGSLASVLLRSKTRTLEHEISRLRVSETRLASLFENSPICMDMKDTDGRYLLVNAAYCDWLKKSPEEILGRTNADVYASDPVRRANVDKIERTVVESGELWKQQVEVVRDGRAHERLIVKFPMRDERGMAVAVGTCAVDLTVQKEAEAAYSRERERARQLESTLREAIMAMPASFAIFDGEDRLLIYNDGFAENHPSFQSDPDLGIGRTFTELVGKPVENGRVGEATPDDEIAAYIEKRLEQHRKADGTPFETWIGERVFVTTETRMPQGGTILLRQDVSEQRRLERERQEAEDLLRNLFENLDQGITIRDLDCRVVRMNKAAALWGELPAEEMIGKTTEELLRHTGHHNEADNVMEEERALMAERRRDVLIRSRVRSDGSTRRIRLSRFPIVGETGEVLGLGALGYDVTELIETQEALEAAKENLEETVLERTAELRSSERRFRNLALASADWFWECDTDGRFTHLSGNVPVPEGRIKTDLIGTSIVDFFAEGAFHSEARASLEDSLRKREPLRDFEVTRPAGGEVRIYRITAMPVHDAEGFLGYTGSTADISELHQARQSLMEAERLASLGSLVAGVAHEINTPIGICVTAISTVSDTARDLGAQLKDGRLTRREFEARIARLREGAELVESNLARAARLVSSFKSVAVDRTSEAERNFNLIEYTREVLESLSPQLGHSGIAVRVFGTEDIELLSYPGAFAQILTNLVMNSIIHGFAERTSGTIEIEVARAGPSATLTYRDDGCGMSADTLRRVFDPFFTTRRGHGGSGLGMHIVFNLVSQVLEGTVQCRSEPGEGVEFEIRFPVRL